MTTDNTQLALSEQQHENRGALADLRSTFMGVPAESIRAGLAEYQERRDTFRAWLQSQLRQDVHFGFPPGCQQESKKGWQAKPSLYKAGADFLCDLMGTRDQYEADIEGWKQLGDPKGTFVYRCNLVSRATGEVIGEGVGAFKIGEKKGMQENAAIKMACKRAKVAAVINAWGLSDLFTQDLEDGDFGPDRHENPERNKAAPKAAPRGRREPPPTRDECVAAFKDFCCFNTDPDEREGFRTFVSEVTQREFDPFVNTNWTGDEYRIVKAEIAKQSGEPE